MDILMISMIEVFACPKNCVCAQETRVAVSIPVPRIMPTFYRVAIALASAVKLR